MNHPLVNAFLEALPTIFTTDSDYHNRLLDTTPADLCSLLQHTVMTHMSRFTAVLASGHTLKQRGSPFRDGQSGGFCAGCPVGRPSEFPKEY